MSKVIDIRTEGYISDEDVSVVFNDRGDSFTFMPSKMNVENEFMLHVGQDTLFIPEEDIHYMVKALEAGKQCLGEARTFPDDTSQFTQNDAATIAERMHEDLLAGESSVKMYIGFEESVEAVAKYFLTNGHKVQVSSWLTDNDTLEVFQQDA